MDRWQYLFVLAACLAITAPLEIVRRRRVSAGLAHRRRRTSGRRGVRRVGCGRHRRARVDLQPALRHRLRAAGFDADRGAAVLRGDTAVRAADLQRRRRASSNGCGGPEAKTGRLVMTGLGYTLPAVVAVLAVCRAGVRRVADRAVPPCGVLDLDGDRAGIPDPGRRLAHQAQRADRHLRRSPHQRCAVPVRHPRRGLPVRMGDGHRGAVAVGTSAAARPREGSAS